MTAETNFLGFTLQDTEAEIKRIDEELFSAQEKANFHNTEFMRLIQEDEEIKRHFDATASSQKIIQSLQQEKHMWLRVKDLIESKLKKTEDTSKEQKSKSKTKPKK